MFYSIFVIGVIWSEAPTQDIISMLMRMILYLLCPLLFVFFDVKDNVKAFFIGFAACVVLSVFLSLFSHISGIGFFQQNIGIHTELLGYKIDLFRGHTYQNFFAGLVSIALIILIIEGYIKESLHKIMTMVLIFIIFIDVFFIVSGRTGQILYILMLIILVFYYLRWKKALIVSLVFIFLTGIVVYLSPNIRKGIDNAISDIQSYKTGYANTSLGLRLTFYKNGIQLFKESPIIGHGTGSFKHEYEKLNDEVMKSVGNPHNDYLWFAVELGIMGLFFFIIFLSLSVYQANNNLMPFSLMTMILVLTYLLSSINNSFFTDNITGQFFMLAMCAIFSYTKR